MLFLHGFPDTAWSYAPVLKLLAAAGYRSVAPFMRGYAPTGLAPDGDYTVPTIARDVLGLIRALNHGDPAFVVGHDWGAVVTYSAALQNPALIRRMATAAVPHLHRFLLRPSARQLLRSRYIAYFQLRGGIPERRIVAKDFAWLRDLIRTWSPGWAMTEAEFAPLRATFSQPAHLQAALAYYRALPGALAQRALWPQVFAPVSVPTLMLRGLHDGCIGPEMFEDQSRNFTAGYELATLDAGHFMQCEQPAVFAQHLIRHFQKN